MSLIFYIIIVLISSVYGKITFQNGMECSQIALENVKQISDVLVETEFHLKPNEKFEKINFVIRSTNKHKKHAYVYLAKKYKGVIEVLIKMKIIPNQKIMTRSVLHHNYLRKSKKWEFLRYFYIYALKEDIPEIMQNLERFHPQAVKMAPIVNYLDEKFVSIAAFIEAKRQLLRVIKQKLDNQYRIFLTKDVEIITQKIQNQQLIQKDLQTEFNHGKLDDDCSQSSSKLIRESKSIHGYYADPPKIYHYRVTKLAIKVLFQIVHKSVDMEDSNQSEDQSISDFQRQLARSGGIDLNDPDDNENENDEQIEEDNEEIHEQDEEL